MKATQKWSTMLLAGMAAMVLSFGLVLAGCDDGGVQEVKVVTDKANAVAAVTATLTSDDLGVIISWDAVDNAYDYNIYYQQEGKKTIQSFSSYAQNAKTYDPADGTEITNTDVDKWSVLAELNSRISLISSKKYRFGVQVTDFSYNDSDIVWSGYIAVP
ncbi:hypothetical protein FACS1894172_20540 [Spirochaetia bacterium]|nr:hypothetical protein FACS1894172_20540 [Spirochaetia bacterium]